jgi:DNA N-6-adenine-methyltransferase (Dam)
MSTGLGIGGHHSPKPVSYVWLTPPDVLAKLGEFDLDPCAAFPRPWDTARVHYTEADDGLSLPWHGRIWLNSPYGPPSVIRPWMKKMAEHNCGTSLIFARVETEAFFDYVWSAATAILFIKGRLFFHHQSGKRAANNAGGPSALCAYGEADARILKNSGIDGRYIYLNPPVIRRHIVREEQHVVGERHPSDEQDGGRIPVEGI